MASELIGPDLDKMWPLIGITGQSDTVCVENVLEILVAGYSQSHAMMMLIPVCRQGPVRPLDNELIEQAEPAFTDQT